MAPELLVVAGANALVVVDVPSPFGAVGQFYRTFGQTSDSEVLALLAEARARDGT